jgi:hypothetical protein
MLQPGHGGTMNSDLLIGINWGGVFVMAMLAATAFVVVKSKLMR